MDAVRAAIPKKKSLITERTFDEATGKAKVRLRFEETNKPPGSGKLKHNPLSRPAQEAGLFVHNKVHSVEKDNSGVEGAHKSEEAAERLGKYGARKVKQGYRSHKLKPYRNATKAEKAADKANVKFLYQKSLRDNPQLTSNPVSRLWQKQRIKKQYAKEARNAAKGAAANTAKAAKKTAETTQKTTAFVGRHWKGLAIVAAALLLLIMLLAGVSSIGTMLSGGLNAVVGTSYTSEDSDLVGTEQDYAALENGLQSQIDNIERDHPGYDEYRYNLDEIGHNPHELASLLTALYPSYTRSQVQAELQRIFNQQYKLTLTETVEVRYRTETHTDTWTDEDGNTYSDTYTVEVPYNYYILTVTLKSKSIASFVPERLTPQQLELYQAYLQTSGNRPLIFGGGSADGTPSEDLSGVHFVNGTRPGNPAVVERAKSQVGNVGGAPYWSWYGFLKAACETAQAVCASLTKEKKTVAPPKLFDLTSLQREANRIYGYTAKQTLDLAQTLYEKRLLTYPRTDSQFLTDDMGDTAAGIIALLLDKLPFMQGVDNTPDVTRILNSKKVSDHHAIIPTQQLTKTDLATLPETERNILTLTGVRLLCATAEPHSFEAVTATFDCAGTAFAAKGKTVLCAGWKDLDRRFRATLKKKADPEDEDNDLSLNAPPFTEGQTFENPPAKVTEHDTTPPKQHTEDTLLSAMERAGSEETTDEAERKGLGTPATRAAVIEKLVHAGFAERKGKQLIPTKDGHKLVCVLPDTLTSPQLTAEWENNLTLIAKGTADPNSFTQGIEEMARVLVETYPFLSGETSDLFKTEKPVLGNCPRCGASVHEGKKNYYCADKDCAFVMWKNDHFFEERKTTFSPKLAAALLKNGKANVKGLYSPKTGKTYDGTVFLADTGGKYVNYRIELTKKK